MQLNQGSGRGDREELSHKLGLDRTGDKELRGRLPPITSSGSALTDVEARLPQKDRTPPDQKAEGVILGCGKVRSSCLWYLTQVLPG